MNAPPCHRDRRFPGSRAFARCPHEEQLALTVGFWMAVNPRMPPTSVSVSSARRESPPTAGVYHQCGERWRPFGKVQRVIGLGDAQWAREETALVRRNSTPIPTDEGSRGSYTPLIMPIADSRKSGLRPSRGRDTLADRAAPADAVGIGAVSYEGVMPNRRHHRAPRRTPCRRVQNSPRSP